MVSARISRCAAVAGPSFASSRPPTRSSERPNKGAWVPKAVCSSSPAVAGLLTRDLAPGAAHQLSFPLSRHTRRSRRNAATTAAVTDAASEAALSVALSPAHGYVALSLVFAVFVHQFWMNFQVGMARKKYDVPYPALYADGDSEEARTFNCVQRGHQNSLEGYAGFLSLLLVSGIQFPLTAAISGVVYTLGKIFYFRGYATGDPNKRLQGAFSYFALFTLIGCVIRTGVSLAF